jgi:hypothetical protein
VGYYSDMAGVGISYRALPLKYSCQKSLGLGVGLDGPMVLGPFLGQAHPGLRAVWALDKFVPKLFPKFNTQYC